MSEHWNNDDWTSEQTKQEEQPLYRRFPDVVSLIFGLGALLVSGYVFSGQWWLPSIDPRWAIAGGALLVGLLLLGASLRPRRRR